MPSHFAHRVRGAACVSLAATAVAAAGELTQTGASRAVPGLRAHTIQAMILPATAPSQFDATTRLDDETVVLRLFSHSLRSSSFQVIVDHGHGVRETVVAPAPLTYRGSIVGEPGSAIAASLIDGRLTALVQRAGGERWYVEPLANLDPAAPAGEHVGYRAADVIGSGGMCGNDLYDLAKPVPDDVKPQDAAGDDGGIAGGNKFLAEIAFDADFEFFNKNGSSVANTVADIENVMNQVEFIYDRDVDINYEFVAIVVRDTAADPYDETDAGNLLCEFRTQWNGAPENQIQREVAQLFTGKALDGTILGIAWNGTVCNVSAVDCGAFGNLGYSLVESRFSGATFNERVALSCHEAGHNWGAAHCDGQGDCHIMCSGLGGCDGIAGVNLKFGAPEVSDIVAYRNSVTCDLLLTAPSGPPFIEPWPSIASSKWVYNNGGTTSTAATNEPSSPNSLNLDATGGNLYDDDEIRSNFILLGSFPQDATFSYFTQHKGVENGEQLVVEYLNSALDWVAINTVTSNGVDQANFVAWSHELPSDAKHDEFRIRFRAAVNESNDDWYIDDVKVELAPGPANDDCAGAATIVSPVTFFNNDNASTSQPPAPVSCNELNGQTLVNDLWYKYTAACTGTLTVSTCNLTGLDTRLIVYAGGACPTVGTVPLGCDDDAPGCTTGGSTVVMPVVAAQQVFIRLGVISGFGSGNLLVSCSSAAPDADGDGVPDSTDNCDNTPNPNQQDGDGDGVGDVCDNCPAASNANQADADGDGVGDACEPPDADGDGVPDSTDNCDNTPNPNQADGDGDGVGDVCDNCPATSNANQQDADGDGIGDVCDTPPCPADFDGNGVVDGGDLGVLLGAWATSSELVDLDGNGIVDGGDLGLLLGSWGSCDM